MKRVEKSSVVALAAGALHEQIRSGQWQGRLPGTRILAERLGLSAPTVAAALSHLAEKGLVESGGGRRAYRVTAAGLKAAPEGEATQPPRRKDLLILTHEEPGRLVDSTRRLIETLQRKLSELDWRVRSQVVDFYHVRKPQAAWDRMIDLEEHTRIIAVYGRPVLAKWALGRNAKILFLGGDPGGLPVPKVSVSSTRMAELALAKLTELGHRRIVLPLCDRGEGFKQELCEATQRALEAAGGSYMRGYHNPESDYAEPDVMRRILDAGFAMPPPTAYVLIDWKEAVAVHCYLAQAGLQVPRDVSLVVLSDSITAEWFHPALCRFRFPQRRLLVEIMKWLEDKPGSDKGAALAGVFVAGDSIGPAPDV